MNNLYLYREDGAEVLVELLDDSTTEEVRSVRLRCVKTLRSSPLLGQIKENSEWTSTCRVGFESYMWSLKPVG